MTKERIFNYELLGEDMLFPVADNSSLMDANRFHRPSLLRKMRRENDPNLLQYLLTRKTVLRLLDVRDFKEIPSLFGDVDRKRALHERFVSMYARQYGLEDLSEAEKEGMVVSSLDQADRVIELFENPENGLLKQYHASIEVTNEIKAIRNPIDLMLIMFSPKATMSAQYEARRKLLLMDLAYRSAASTEDSNRNLDEFLHFMNTNLFNGVIGAPNDLEVLSLHSPEDYSTVEVRVLTPEDRVRLSALSRYTKLSTRTWQNMRGRDRQVYIESRAKNPRDIILKMMRKETKNPFNIDDQEGTKFVFLEKADIFDFLDRMQEEAAASGSLLSYEEVYDTIDNDSDYRITNRGSSDKLQIVKVHAKFEGKTIEFQMHTVRSYLDSRYHDQTGFESAYSMDRLFDSGIVEMLYPPRVYGLNLEAIHRSLKMEMRDRIRRTAMVDLPPERLVSNPTEEYTFSEFIRDLHYILRELPDFPDQIVGVGTSGAVMAPILSKMLGGVPIFHYRLGTEPLDTKALHPLIVSGIMRDGRKVKEVKERLPQAMTAVLGLRDREEEVARMVDVVAKHIDPEKYYNYFWELPNLEMVIGQGIVLFYRFNTANQMEILAESLPTDKQVKYKLVGGKHERYDRGLRSTALRELKEETGLELNEEDLIPLPTVKLTAEKIQNTQAQTAFFQGFCLKVDGEFALDTNVDGSVLAWITVEEFLENALWSSQAFAMQGWAESIWELERSGGKPENGH